MEKSVLLRGLLFVMSFSFIIGCSNSVDINKESAVLKDIQGAWTGCRIMGKVYRHFKLTISKDAFEGWIQVSDSEKEPVWAKIPDEKGFLSLTSLLNDDKKNLKYRKFTLRCDGRCCGDKSLSIETISDIITYQEGKGLVLDGKVKMMKK